IVRDAAVDVAAKGQVAHLDRLAIEASATLPIDGSIAAEIDLRAMWREKRVPISIATALEKHGETIDVAPARAAAGGLAVFARDVRVVGKRVHGSILGVATPRGVRTIAPEAPLAGAIAIAARVDGGLDGRAMVALAGFAGGAPMLGGGVIDSQARRAKL